MIRKKKPRVATSYNRRLLELIDRYIKESGEDNPDYHYVAAWAHRKGLLAPRQRDVVRQIAQDLARASNQDYITNEKGEPVRHRLSYKETRGDKQLRFWFKMEGGTPEKMRLNASDRRNGAVMDVLQIVRDLNYFNENYNPGDPIQMDFDFTKDIADHEQPTEYEDSPPEEDPDKPDIGPTKT
jgi:hypothetical protein